VSIASLDNWGPQQHAQGIDHEVMKEPGGAAYLKAMKI